MRNAFWKNIIREIKGSFGRYIAIFLIIALGVGFFSGLAVSRDAMLKTGNDFFSEYNFYDFRLLSTIGFEKNAVKKIAELDGVSAAEGSVWVDFQTSFEKTGEERDPVIRMHSITNEVNQLKLIKGRMPERADEIVVERKFFKDSYLGEKIIVDGQNSSAIKKSLKYDEYTIVGFVESPNYINFERGTTNVGLGTINAYAYAKEDAFNTKRLNYYMELLIKLDGNSYIYSDEYDAKIAEHTAPLQQIGDILVEQREEALKKNASFGQIFGSVLQDMFLHNRQLEPECFVFNRSGNIGYSAFENDTQIVKGISRVFPIFFFLVAALVCVTTMTRMIEEQRTQIGTLKALGYSDGKITAKYLFYSGSAAIFGCIVGFFAGTAFLPMLVWKVYGILYTFAEIKYIFDARLLIISLIVAVLCSIVATYLSIRRTLKEQSASLMRPKAPKRANRIFLEKIPFIWRNIGFLHKVSFRNISRYKSRMLMMILGIAGCTALLLTGFGMKDSISGLPQSQFNEIMEYDASVHFSSQLSPQKMDEFKTQYSKYADDIVFFHESSVQTDVGGRTKSIYLVVSDCDLSGHLNLLKNGEHFEYPKTNEAVIDEALAREYGVGVGDTITVKDASMNTLSVRVSGICENYVYNYVFLHSSTCQEQWNYIPEYKTACLKLKENVSPSEMRQNISLRNDVLDVIIVDDMEMRVTEMLGRLDYIILIVGTAAALLAFIVLYNLTNINITERKREIATIKVLGFNSRETSQYVMRENMILTFIGGAFGLILGIFLHKIVMAQVKIDMVSFAVKIYPESFALAFAITVVFAFVINLFMNTKLKKINMAESLKNVE